MKIIEYEDKYLNDVKDLLVELEEYIVSIDKNNLRPVLSQMIDSFIKIHNLKKEATDILISNWFITKNIHEKVYIAYGHNDNYCHEVVYHKHTSLNYHEMKEEILNIITSFFE